MAIRNEDNCIMMCVCVCACVHWGYTLLLYPYYAKRGEMLSVHEIEDLDIELYNKIRLLYDSITYLILKRFVSFL